MVDPATGSTRFFLRHLRRRYGAVPSSAFIFSNRNCSNPPLSSTTAGEDMQVSGLNKVEFELGFLMLYFGKNLPVRCCR